MAEPRPPAAGAVARRPNRAVMLFLSALVLWFLLQLLLGTGYGPDPGELLAAVPLLGRGLALTAYISFVSLILGSLFALMLLFGLIMPWPSLNWALVAWCTIFRGTPMIAQLYLVYYGAGEIHGWLDRAHLWWFFREPLNCVMIAFRLTAAAWHSTLWSGSFRAICRRLDRSGRGGRQRPPIGRRSADKASVSSELVVEHCGVLIGEAQRDRPLDRPGFDRFAGHHPAGAYGIGDAAAIEAVGQVENPGLVHRQAAAAAGVLDQADSEAALGCIL